MKKIKYIIILSGILLINSCDTKDLNTVNPNTLSPETYFTTAAQVQSAINATYANLQTHALYSRHIFFTLDNMSHENMGNPQLEADKKVFVDYSFDSSSFLIQTIWQACYLGINKANFVISNQAKINAIPNGVLSQVMKNKFIAEARFMRAYYYFLLVNRFGDIPIYEEPTTVGKARSPKADVYKLIEADFDYASKNLLSKNTEEKGRATKEAAFGYLGKVLLYQKKYDEALVALNNVTGFSLESNFYNNFMDETEHGPESVFEVEYDEALGTGAQWNSPTSGQGANESTFRGQEYGNLGWFNVYPSDDLLDEYEPGDKRFGDTFYVVGSKYDKDTKTMTVDNFKVGQAVRRAAWKKYQNYYKRDNENINSSINFKVMRYSDVLLMKAECENQRANGSQTNAIALIKQVRDRAGLITNITPTKDAVFKAIIHERKVEFAGEQLRFDDIVRWHNADTQLIGTNFNPNKHYLWPIPDVEFSSNPNIGKDNNPNY